MKNKKILHLLLILWFFSCFFLLKNNEIYINPNAKDKGTNFPLHLSNNYFLKEWNYSWGGVGDECAFGLAIDSSENIYLTGITNSFGALSIDICLVKYNSAGVLQWNYTWGGTDDDYAFNLALDSLDNIYIAGYTESFGAMGRDICLLKYNSAGVLQWNYTWGGTEDDYAHDLALDSSDNIYLTGTTKSFGALYYDICLLKYNSAGVLQWNYTWGGTDHDKAYGIAIDSSDNIYLIGDTLNGDLDQNTCLLKYNSTGALQWIYTWGGAGIEFARGIAIDSSDNIYITGSTTSFGALNFEVFLLKYNIMGTLQWNYTWAGAEGNWGRALALDSSDNIYLIGDTNVIGEPETDIFLLKYNTKGSLQSNYSWGGAEDDDAYGLALDSLNNIYLTGTTNSFGALGYDIYLFKFDTSPPQNVGDVNIVIFLITVLSMLVGIGLTATLIVLWYKRKNTRINP